MKKGRREEEGEACVGRGCRLRVLAAVDGDGRALLGARLRSRALQWQRNGGLGGENGDFASRVAVARPRRRRVPVLWWLSMAVLLRRLASVVRTVTLLRSLRRRGRAGDEYRDYGGCLWLSMAVLLRRFCEEVRGCFSLPRLLKSKMVKTTNLKLLLLMIWTQWYNSTLSLQCFQVV